jgi:hypothetical protein
MPATKRGELVAGRGQLGVGDVLPVGLARGQGVAVDEESIQVVVVRANDPDDDLRCLAVVGGR